MVYFGGAVFIRVSSDSFHSASTASLLLSVVVEGYKRKKIYKTCSEVLVLQPYNKKKKKNCSGSSLDGGTGQLIALEEWWEAFSCWLPSVLSNGEGKCTTHYRNPTHVRAINRKSLSNKHILVERGRRSYVWRTQTPC